MWLEVNRKPNRNEKRKLKKRGNESNQERTGSGRLISGSTPPLRYNLFSWRDVG